jgi:hypothetical protein
MKYAPSAQPKPTGLSQKRPGPLNLAKIELAIKILSLLE